MDAINETRLRVWPQQPAEFFTEAIIEADGTMVATDGECKQGMDIAYNGDWGYHPLVVSLANTGEPLFLVNRSGNRPSHEQADDSTSTRRSASVAGRASARSCCGATPTSRRPSIWTAGTTPATSASSSGSTPMHNLKALAEDLPAEAYRSWNDLRDMR